MWQEKYRPKDLESIALCDETREKILEYIEKGEIPHLLMCGPVGIGKTSLARMLPHLLGWDYKYINASDESGIDTIRDKVKSYAEKQSTNGKPKIIILDEAGGLSSKGGEEGGAQGALKNVMEQYYTNIRFVLTANNESKLITPVLSRCLHLNLDPPIFEVFDRIKWVCDNEHVEFDTDVLKQFVSDHYPDMRSMLKILESSIRNGKFVYTKSHRKTAFAKELLNQILDPSFSLNDIREHYLNNGAEFDNDFHLLMTQIHEVLMGANLSSKKVRNCMLALHEAIRDFNNVIDKEIHFFSLCFLMREQSLE